MVRCGICKEQGHNKRTCEKKNDFDECCICFENKLLKTTSCGHKFCEGCIEKLYECALCRAKLKDGKPAYVHQYTPEELALYQEDYMNSHREMVRREYEERVRISIIQAQIDLDRMNEQETRRREIIRQNNPTYYYLHKGVQFMMDNSIVLVGISVGLTMLFC